MYHIFFIHSSVDGYLGCFHVLAIVKSAAVNTGMNVIFLNYGFLWVCAQEWLGHMAVLFLVFEYSVFEYSVLHSEPFTFPPAV